MKPKNPYKDCEQYSRMQGWDEGYEMKPAPTNLSQNKKDGLILILNIQQKTDITL